MRAAHGDEVRKASRPEVSIQWRPRQAPTISEANARDQRSPVASDTRDPFDSRGPNGADRPRKPVGPGDVTHKPGGDAAHLSFPVHSPATLISAGRPERSVDAGGLTDLGDSRVVVDSHLDADSHSTRPSDTPCADTEAVAPGVRCERDLGHGRLPRRQGFDVRTPSLPVQESAYTPREQARKQHLHGRTRPRNEPHRHQPRRDRHEE